MDAVESLPEIDGPQKLLSRFNANGACVGELKSGPHMSVLVRSQPTQRLAPYISHPVQNHLTVYFARNRLGHFPPVVTQVAPTVSYSQLIPFLRNSNNRAVFPVCKDNSRRMTA